MLESRARANRKWNEANLDRLAITVRKGQRDVIKAAAEKAGVSVNRYVVEAVEARMAAEADRKAEDLFYSPSNMAHLLRGVAALDAGEGVEHELIEAADG